MAEYVYKMPGKKLMPEVEEALKQMNKAWEKEDAKRDIRALMYILSRLEVVDPRLTGYIQTRTTAIASYDWEIVANDPKDARGVELAAEVFTRCEDAIGELIRSHINTYLFGVLCCQINWNQDKAEGNKWVPTLDEPLMPYDVEFMRDSQTYPLNVALLTHDETGAFTRNAIENVDNYIVDTYRGSYRGGLMVSILFREILLNMTIQDWANFNRKLKGIIVSTYKTLGAQPGDIAASEEAAKKSGSASYLSVSDAVKLEFQRLVDALGKDSYKEFKEALEADIAIAIKGEANTHELPKGGGSRAATEVQYKISADITWMTILDIIKLVNKQFLPAEYRMNQEKTYYGKLPYKFRFKIQEAKDYEANGRVIAMARENGMPVKKKEAYDNMGLTVPESGEEVIEPLASVV